MNITDVLNRLKSVHKCGNGFTAMCPAHDDRRASLSVSEGADGRVLVKCHAGCSAEAVAAAMGLRITDLFPVSPKPDKPGLIRRTPETEYVYKDMRGEPAFKKVRYAGKQFMWFHKDENGRWAKGRGGKSAPLYNQFDALTHEFVWVVEGEKDVETLRKYGLPAVSLPDGAKTKWQDEYAEWFELRKVCIIRDNDEPGRQCAAMVAANIVGRANAVKVIDLSEIWEDIPAHGDVSDFLQAFPEDGKKRLTELAGRAPFFTPEQVPPESGVIRLSDVQSTETDWLWYPYIPRGKITLLTADPGLGKTFFALYLAACVSTGRPFWGTGEPYRQPEKAVYQTAEDGVADTIKPRLEPMTPNFANILMIDETSEGLDLSDERIESLMMKHKPALIVFDPLQAYLGADVDMHRANEVRPVLAHLAKLAEAANTAVVLIMHNSKTSQNKALYRALGSIDIPAVARSMLIMGKDPDCEGRRVICHEKSSLARRGKSMTFEIKPGEGGVSFCGFSELTADDVLTPSGTYFRASDKRDSAEDLLTELLGEKGWCDLDEIKQAAEERGISSTTMHRMKAKMKLESVTMGFKVKKTYWLSPDVDKEQFKADLTNSTEENSVLSTNP